MPHTSRYDEFAATLTAQGIDGFGEGLGIKCDTIAYSTEVLEADLAVRELGCLYLRHRKRQVSRILLIRILTMCTGLALIASVLLG